MDKALNPALSRVATSSPIISDYTIVTAANERFAGGLVMLMKSINRTWASSAPLRVVVLDDGLTNAAIGRSRAVLTWEAPNVEMRCVSVSNVVPRDLPVLNKAFAPTNYARLWIPEIIAT